MAGKPGPDPKTDSPLDKLSQDVARYQQAQKHPRPAAPAPRPPAPRQAAAPVPPRLEATPAAQTPTKPAQGPGWPELDRGLSSQMSVWLLITGYTVLVLTTGAAAMLVLPSALSLWPVLAIGVIVSMIASHKGRPPLLWFMYGSVVPMIPLLGAVSMAMLGKMTAGAAGGLDMLGLIGGQGAPGAAQQAAAASMIELFLCVCVVGLVPVVHVLVADRNSA
jgi:hypothetical protein